MGMSGDKPHQISEVWIMCNFGNNNNCFGGGNLCWIIILLILFCNCGNNSMCDCGCDNNRCC